MRRWTQRSLCLLQLPKRTCWLTDELTAKKCLQKNGLTHTSTRNMENVFHKNNVPINDCQHALRGFAPGEPKSVRYQICFRSERRQCACIWFFVRQLLTVQCSFRRFLIHCSDITEHDDDDDDDIFIPFIIISCCYRLQRGEDSRGATIWRQELSSIFASHCTVNWSAHPVVASFRPCFVLLAFSTFGWRTLCYPP